MRKRTWLLGLGAAAVAVVLGAGAIMAQSEEDVPGTSFLDRVAGKLGIGSDELEQAIRDARTDEINERVADGDLTQEEADELIERLDSLPDGAPFLFGGVGRGFDFEFRHGPNGFAFGFGGPGGPMGGLGFLCSGVAGEELAEFLGISEEELREQLRADGATLATVAEANGKSREELKAFIVDSARTRTNEAVAEGNIDQARADEIIANLEENLDEVIDGEFFSGKFRFRFGPGSRDEMLPDDGTQEQGGTFPGRFRS